jgi:hypothetical protein
MACLCRRQSDFHLRRSSSLTLVSMMGLEGSPHSDMVDLKLDSGQGSLSRTHELVSVAAITDSGEQA